MSNKKFWDNKESSNAWRLYEFCDLDEETQASVWCRIYDIIFKKLSDNIRDSDIADEAERISDGIINNIDVLTLEEWKNMEVTI